MIRVSHLRDFTRPEAIHRRKVEWGIGSTARALAPEWAEPGDPLVGCSRNGAPVTDWDALLCDGDHVHYWARPGIQIALASAFLVNLGNAVLFSLYALLIQKLIAPTRKPAEPGDDSSTTYGQFNLRTNRRGDGGPIPVVYGRTRVTPYIVNEYVRSSLDSDGNPSSEYVAMYLIGEGPIQSIGGKTADGGPFSAELANALDSLQINDQPAAHFQGVEAHVRLGNLDQTPISEFADAVLTHDVDKTLRDSSTLTHAATVSDSPSGTTAIAQVGSFSAGDANITKWDAEESFTASDEADEFVAVLEFPQGLVSYNATTAAAEPNNVIYQIRYREVDGGGTPFGNYVVLPAQRLSLSRAGLFRAETRRRFYDPASYGFPSIGKSLEDRSTTASNNPGIYYTVSGTFAPAAPADLQFSVAFWMSRRTAMAVGTSERLFQWTDAPAFEGCRVTLIRNSTTSTVRFEFGTGASFVAVDMTDNSFNDLTTTIGTNWSEAVRRHIVLTYQATATGCIVKFFLNGAHRHGGTSAAQMILDSTQPMRFGSDSHTAPTLGAKVHFDEPTTWHKALTPYEVSSLYNGNGPIAIDAAAPGLIVGARCDAGLGPSPNIGTAPFGPYVAGDRWIFGSGTNAVNDPGISAFAGIVYTPETGTPKRGKYLVEMMRLDTEDTSSRFLSEVSFKAIQLWQLQDFEFPGMAVMAVKIPSTDQLSGETPSVSVIVEGKLVPVWDGVNADYPNMVDTYSRNPAWVSADATLNRDYGLGGLYQARSLDLPQLQALATFCDTRIYDNLGRTQFTEAAYRDTTEEPVIGSVYGDTVRYKVAALPPNFPGVGPTAGKYIKPIMAGLTPAAPAWLTTQAGLVAQEIVFVQYAGGVFEVYTRTTQALGPGQTVYTVSGGQADTNGLEIHDVRCRFDGVFDRADYSAWDAVLQILQTARAAPIRIGSRLSYFIDDVAEPVALITMGSIVEGSWEQGGMGVADRPNAESSEINNEVLDFERDPVVDEHPDINDPSTQSSFRWRRVSLEGITRAGQAKRHLRRDLNTFFLVREWCSFEMGIDSLPLLPGDIVAISHDVPQVGFSGRMYADGTNTTVKLDRPITLPASGWQIQVEDTASNTRYTVAVTQGAGTYAAGTALTVAAFPAAFAPAQDDEYAIGPVATGETQLFRLVESTLDPRSFKTRCRFLEYNPDVYDDDFGDISTTTNSLLPVPRAPTVPAGVENLTVSEVTTRGPDGSVRVAASVTFDHMAETFGSVGGSDVYVVEGGVGVGYGGAIHKAHLGSADTTVVVEHQFTRDVEYTVYVVPRARDGSGSWASWASFTPSGLAPTPRKPKNLRGSSVGELVSYQWDDDDDLDQGATVEIRRGGWILGIPVASTPAQARSTGPIADWAGGPENEHGVVSTDLVARVKLRTGQYGEAEVLTFEPAIGTDGSAHARSEEDFDFS